MQNGSILKTYLVYNTCSAAATHLLPSYIILAKFMVITNTAASSFFYKIKNTGMCIYVSRWCSNHSVTHPHATSCILWMLLCLVIIHVLDPHKVKHKPRNTRFCGKTYEPRKVAAFTWYHSFIYFSICIIFVYWRRNTLYIVYSITYSKIIKK